MRRSRAVGGVDVAGAGELSWRTGWSKAARDATGSWSGSRRWSTGRRSSGSFARSMPPGRAAVVRTGSAHEMPAAAAVVSSVRPGARGSALRSPVLPPLRRPGARRPVPDHSTLSRFRTELSRRGVAERLLADSIASLILGLMVKAGTLIDASLVAADCRRPRRPSQRRAAATRMRLGTRCPRSRCSATRCTWRWIRALAWCAGHAHVRPRLGQGAVFGSRPGDERTVYADRGYDGWWYRRELARRGIADGIMTGNYRQRPVDAAGHARIGPSGRSGRRSSAPSRSSSAGTAIAACATAP